MGKPIKPRLVCDFSHINDMIIPPKAPIPTIPDIIEQLGAGQNTQFSILDISSAHYAINMAADSRDICSINTRKQKYCFNKLPMGMINSGPVFSAIIARCLSTLDSRYIINYVDKIIIATPTMELHLTMLNKLLWRLRQVGLRISPLKVKLMKTSLEYLGFLFDKYGVRAIPEKLQPMVKLPEPRNAKETKGVMGTFNFYRRFTKGYASIAKPLNQLLRDDEPFIWNFDCTNSLRHIESRITAKCSNIFTRSEPTIQDCIRRI